MPLSGWAADEKPKFDSGDTAWMLTSTALVLMMTIPGLALFYGGMVRAKNVLGMLMQNFFAMGILAVLVTFLLSIVAARATGETDVTPIGAMGKITQFTYAVGRLVLYSTMKGLVENETSLRAAKFDKLAIANPSAAPYGAAAVEAMQKLGAWEALRPKIVAFVRAVIAASTPWVAISASMSSNAAEVCALVRFARRPVRKLSTPTTRWPSRKSWSEVWLPMKPAAPVTRIVDMLGR